jgi:hypothetical protein
MSLHLPASPVALLMGIMILLAACIILPGGEPVSLTSVHVTTKASKGIEQATIPPLATVFEPMPGDGTGGIGTSQPTIAPTAYLSPTELPAGILFIDDFTNPLSGWDVRQDSNAITDYHNGEFVIFVGKTETTLWSKPNHYMTNVSIEVDTREAGGPDDNLYGVICRYQDANNFYLLVIAGNGYAGITKRAEGVVTVLSGPFLTRSPAVNRGLASNHLKAVCKGTQLSLYVNEQLVVQAQDGDFMGGDVGLLASTGKHLGVEIHFSHFIVKQP